MIKIPAWSLAILLFFSCNNKKDIPDVSGINVNIPVERFDKDFFSIDTNAIEQSLPVLTQKYPTFLPIFIHNILGLDSINMASGIPIFIRLTQPIQDSVNKIFTGSVTTAIKNDFEKAFRYTRYYFPEYWLPKIITVTGPVDAWARMSNGEYTPAFLGPDFLGISLQFYLGSKFSIYQAEFFITNVAPLYRSRRFTKEYIIADGMKRVVDDLFPDKSSGRGLIEQMIEKGKQWWLLDKFMPEAPDSVKTGYTQKQLDWCKKYEGLIWQNIITNEKDLYTIEPEAIQTYIGEAPFTPNMPEASPGNIGQWIGWQIIKKFAEKNPGMKPEQVMQTDAKKILEEAKYKPK